MDEGARRIGPTPVRPHDALRRAARSRRTGIAFPDERERVSRAPSAETLAIVGALRLHPSPSIGPSRCCASSAAHDA